MIKKINIFFFFFVLACSTNEEGGSGKVLFSLSVSSSLGGSVDISRGNFDQGTRVTITASPQEGYMFSGWSGVGANTNPLTIVMTENKEITAVFIKKHSYTFNNIELNAPPFSGTIWITGDIVTASDPSLFEQIQYNGREARLMYDRRNGGDWINIEPFLFDALFTDGLTTEIQVNPEFNFEQATTLANKYAFLIGQLPKALRKDVHTMWIHKGEEPYGGGNNNILIHTGMSKIYESHATGNIIEETLIHEATHTSIDPYYYPDRLSDGSAWINAVQKDNGCYISTYAKDYKYREDLAELMPLYVAVKYFPDRIANEIRDKILSCSLHRVLFLDSLDLDMSLYED